MPEPALLVVDVQRGLEDPRWGRRDNPDCERNRASLDALAATGARTVLTGHGEPWTGGAEAIAAAARETPIA